MDLRASALARLYGDWQARRCGRDMPARADFDPLDLKYILGHLCLLDVHHQPLRFRYRLYGSEIAANFGHEMTGKWVDELPDPEHRRIAHEHFTSVVQQRQPIVSVKDARRRLR